MFEIVYMKEVSDKEEEEVSVKEEDSVVYEEGT